MTVREFVFRRDNYTCRGCGMKFNRREAERQVPSGKDKRRKLTIHHIVPLSCGGRGGSENLISLCAGRKSNRCHEKAHEISCR